MSKINAWLARVTPQWVETERDKFHIRWMIRRDMPEVLRINQKVNGEKACGEDWILKMLLQRNVIGMVGEEQRGSNLVRIIS